MVRRLIFVFFIFWSGQVSAQTKKVLLEEFTGTYCGQCPLGTHYVDSMLALYPNLVSVALHSYSLYDAMNFLQIDTINTTYTQGAPLAAIDRICPGSSSDQTAVFVNQWNTEIQQRLSVPALLTLSVIPSWNASTRNITAQVSINIVSNMSAGDYRLSLYVVEDSVTGIGAGYDQENFYDTDASSPFYGMGNPIVGFVHKHVARALLSSSWGLQGLIPSAPTTGQNFNHAFNYTLPALYDESQVHLVAFVYKFTANHTGDEVLNVTEENLLQSPAAVFNNEPGGNEIAVVNNQIQILDFGFRILNVEIYDTAGKKVLSQPPTSNFKPQAVTIDISPLESGIYFYKIISEEKRMYSGKIMVSKI